HVVHWPKPDSIALRLLNVPGYTITRYVGETAFFNAKTHALDLLAAGKKRLAVVDRDSQVVVSDSGIYYTETTRKVTTGGHYVLTPPPNSGQADIIGLGRVDYNLARRSVRVTNARLPVNNGEMWYMDVALAEVVQDSANGKASPTVYVPKPGSLTSCNDSIPDYKFVYREAKRTAGNTLVARDVMLYIKDIPVMWFPFIFSDTRNGRHSGILPPQFGLGDVVRNSPTYRRNVEHVGYYWALSDYMDFATWLDWRSSAGATENDPGWLRLNSDFNYKWLDRFMAGRIGLAHTSQRDGHTNTAVSWNHQQEFSRNSRLNTNVNYVTSTTLQRQNTFNPYTALATIASQISYQTKIGPSSVSLGATRTQYPGRQQVDQTLPTISLTSTPIKLGQVFSWTPSFSYSRHDVLRMDQPGIGAYVYSIDPATGVRDSALAKNRSASNASIDVGMPLQIFGWDLRNSFRITQERQNFPQKFTLYDVNTGLPTDTRVYAATYRSSIDWNPDFTLPPIARNKFNLSPTLSLQNIDPGPYWVASERTNGHYVHQGKRVSLGMSASPTLFGLFPGFGPFSRIRHSITPTISYSWAPKANVSDEYLEALGRTRANSFTNLAQNNITFGLTQLFQAKIRPKNDSNPESADKIDLLSLNFTPLSYDFERAKGHKPIAGLTTESWGYSLRSDLLPGFDFSSQYSLFLGSTLSDTAQFKPYLTNVSASLRFSRDQNPFVLFAKLFGRAVPAPPKAPTTGTEQVRPPQDLAQQQALAAQPVAGSVRGGDRFIVPPTQGWTASFSLTRSSPRPPKPGSNVIDFDPQARCQQIAGNNPLLLDACLASQRAQPTIDTPVGSSTAGGPAYNIPPTTSLNSDISFSLTPKWAAHWTTTYDIEHHEFAQHIVQLQRELHDWRAIFGFTQSTNGNFAFNFTIALKAEPDIKFDYNRATVRSGSF
ncbi:MAG TPA: putative LPS assembly protein LptD, partial [Gemmatimonadaceae bacterium]|nr:putative LPS assembly protein LptD [Gemmatimonadaceae bacterium]